LKRYLLDTNICIYFIKGLYQLDRKIEQAGPANCFISEMTVAELKYGAENSKTPEVLRPIIAAFLPKFVVIPVYDALDVYAAEKARLRKQGLMLDDFDILIGATAVVNNMVMVSNNHKHLSRISNIDLQDWTTAEPQ
jgi:tRNA(fMet)-specific endonuclease VapC